MILEQLIIPPPAAAAAPATSASTVPNSSVCAATDNAAAAAAVAAVDMDVNTTHGSDDLMDDEVEALKRLSAYGDDEEQTHATIH